MASVEMQKRKREEYEMQLFGVHSRQLFRALGSSVYDTIEEGIQKLSDMIQLKRNLVAEDCAVHEAETKKLIRAYSRGAELHLRSIENVMNKVITVPNNVLLDEDESQAVQYTEEEFNNLLDKLEDLQKRAKRASVLNASLKQELEDLNRFQICENQVNRLCNVIEKGLAYPTVNSRMSELIQNARDLHKHLETLGSPNPKKNYDPKVNDSHLKAIDLNSL